MSKLQLKHSVIYGNEELGLLNEPQIFYALITIGADGETGFSSEISKNICFVIDSSTSMRGKPVDIVKHSLLNINTKLEPKDFLSIVSFNDRAETILRPTRISNLENLSRHVSKIHAVGGTEMYQGLKRGYVQLVRAPEFHKTLPSILLLTDGQTYGDEEMCFRLIKNARSDGISVHGIGIGNDWNDDFLDELVGYAGGTSIYLSEIDRLPTVINNLTKLLHEDSIPQLSFSFETHDRVKLSNVFRLSREVSVLPIYRNQMCIGSIPLKSKIQLLFEFTISPLHISQEELSLLRGKFTINSSVGEMTMDSRPLMIDVPLVIKLNRKAQISEKVRQAVFMTSLYRMQEAARNEIRKGQIQKGVQMLKSLANQLKAQGKLSLAGQILQETLFIENTNNYSASGEKQIKYATRVLPVETQIALSNMKTKKVELK